MRQTHTEKKAIAQRQARIYVYYLYISGHQCHRATTFPNLSLDSHSPSLPVPLCLSNSLYPSHTCTQHASHALADLQTVVSVLKPASCVSWITLFLSFYFSSGIRFVWTSVDKSESITMSSFSPAEYSLQSAFAGFLQIREDLNKDKIRCSAQWRETALLR